MKNIVLIGLSGCGKTTSGVILGREQVLHVRKRNVFGIGKIFP